MSVIRAAKAGACCMAAIGLAALWPAAAYAAEQCVPDNCAKAQEQVALHQKLTSQARSRHFKVLKTIFNQQLVDETKPGDEKKRNDFFAHVKKLNDFTTALGKIDQDAKAPARELIQIEQLVAAVDKVTETGNGLEETRRTKEDTADDSTVTPKNKEYIEALDKLYVVSLSIFNPVGGNDFYTEAESYVDGQRQAHKSQETVAALYQKLQNFEATAPQEPKGNKSLKGLDTFEDFFKQPVGRLVASIARKSTSPATCDELSGRIDSLAVPTETSQALICAQLKLEEATAKRSADCDGCQAQPPPAAQAGNGIKMVSVIYGKLSRKRVVESVSVGHVDKVVYTKDGRRQIVKKEVVKTTYRDKVRYRKPDYCNATNYFRVRCEMLPKEVAYCYKNGDLTVAAPAACTNGTPLTDNEYFSRDGDTKKQVCQIKIDPRMMCGGYVPAETADRLATIRYQCAGQAGATVWEVRPLKRDKETVYLFCPDGYSPSEYAKIADPEKEPIPVEQ